MPVTVVEKFQSPRITTGQNGSIEGLYLVFGAADAAEAQSAVEAEAAAGYMGLPAQSIRLEQSTPTTFDAEVLYASQPPSGSPPPETGQSTTAFDTGGGTQRITQSKATVNRYAAAGATAPDFKGAINVTKDGVEGVDIVVPVYAFEETHYIDDAAVTAVYRGKLFALTGKTNDAAFRGFNEGEVLFLGARGSKRGGPDGEDWEITFRFAASPNRTGLTVGDIASINKKGWEYLWVRYEDQLDEAALSAVKRPTSVHVERVYDAGDFAELAIGVL